MVLLKEIAVLISLASLTSCNPVDNPVKGAPGDIIPQPGLGNLAVPPPPVQLDRLSSVESPSKAAKKVGDSTGQYRQYHFLCGDVTRPDRISNHMPRPLLLLKLSESISFEHVLSQWYCSIS